MNASHSKSARSSQSSRSSSARSYFGPSRLKRTRCCGRSTGATTSIWRKPSRRTVSSTSVALPSSACARTAIRRASSTLTFTVVSGIVSQSTFLEFVREHLPAPPARVLDVGCGQGELTTALAVAGYEVLGIDPRAPSGEHFRRLKLEDLEDSERFDAVVAGFSLHHIRDLDAALDKIAGLLPAGGVLVVDEFAWDRWTTRRSTGSTASGGRSPPPVTATAPASLDELRSEWEAEHLGLHGFAALREALDARFDERAFEWTPHLHRTLAGVASAVLEQALIDAGAIQALGFRYAGVVRPG